MISEANEADMETRVAERVEIRRLQRRDIGATTRLKQMAGWNQTYADWRRFLAISSGCYVALLDGQVIGSVTSCIFETTGWIGMMLVDPVHRRQGIATRLMQTAITSLEQHGCTAIRLDATALGAPVYRRLGFRDEYEVLRCGGRVRDVRSASAARERAAYPPPRAFSWRDWPGLQMLDRELHGEDRTKLLKRLIVENPDSARVVVISRRLEGYALQRPGSSAWFIGPLAARSVAAGNALLWDAFQQTGSCGPKKINTVKISTVKIDIPARNQDALELAARVGLEQQRQFIRMVRHHGSE